jgi:hypothetical protein
MTEAEWLACDNPEQMLAVVRGSAGERKLRLFACACARHFQRGLDLDDCLTEAIDAAEEYADGRLDQKGLRKARTAAESARVEDEQGDEVGLVNVAVTQWSASRAARLTVDVIRTVYARLCVPCESYESARTWMGQDIVKYLREVFGNPFRPVTADSTWPAWNDGAIPKLATALYEEGRFADLPILADALEEAGCDRGDVLDHLRGPGRHVRGCWALDLCLDMRLLRDRPTGPL